MKSWKKYYKQLRQEGMSKDRAYKMARLQEKYDLKLKKLKES